MVLFDCIILDATRDFDGTYSYLGGELSSVLEVGQIVSLPFGRGNGERLAVIAAVREGEAELSGQLKTIRRLVTPEALLLPEHFFLAEEMRRRYFVSRAQALATMLPKNIWSVGRKTGLFAQLKDPEEAESLLSEGGLNSLGRERVLTYLLSEGQSSVEELRLNCGVSQAVLRAMVKAGLILFERQLVERELAESPPDLEVTAVERLNPEQEAALQALKEALKSQEQREFLLHGVTGSGKTEVYLRAAEAALEAGCTAMILVPEIALTPLLEARVRARFGDLAAILHSRLSSTRRFENWLALKRGEKKLAIGARSAIFAPLSKLALIVIDEEQESSYKSELAPRYETADLARLRAHYNHGTLLLSSATPAVASYYRSQTGRAQLLSLPRRAGRADLAEVSLVDLKQSMVRQPGAILSTELELALLDCFARGEQAMLFLNRRGQKHSLVCQDCGQILYCPHCDIALTEHQGRGHQRLICHYCGKIFKQDYHCPHCGSSRVESHGFGTQFLEAHLAARFPEQRFLRMDQDSTYTRRAYQEILESFQRHEADALIGTQMIAKGHDFPRVTVVGIVAADQLLAQSDYQAAERCFQLLTQAAGRAGRGSRPGQVIVQALQPEHYAIQAGVRQDYGEFYKTEIEHRKRFNYPPFGHIAVIILSGADETVVRREALAVSERLAQALADAHWQQDIELFPAQAAPLAKLRSRYRQRIILKGSERESLTHLLNWEQQQALARGVTRQMDINPNSLL